MSPCVKSEDRDSKMGSPSPESICKQPMKNLSPTFLTVPSISERIRQRSIKKVINFKVQGSSREKIHETIRSVYIPLSDSLQFILDWAEGKANQDVDFKS